jgi:hypothetical protein
MSHGVSLALLIASAFMFFLRVRGIVNPSFGPRYLKPGTRTSAVVSSLWWAMIATFMGLTTFGRSDRLESFFVPLAAIQLLAFLLIYFGHRRRKQSNLFLVGLIMMAIVVISFIVMILAHGQHPISPVLVHWPA